MNGLCLVEGRSCRGRENSSSTGKDDPKVERAHADILLNEDFLNGTSSQLLGVTLKSTNRIRI